MENKIFTKFNIYDQVGYLLVGSIALLVLVFDFHLFNKISLLPGLSTTTLIVWFVLAYFLGHIFQAIANLIVKEDKNKFTDSEKEIIEEAKNYFKVEKQSLNEIYYLCYMLAFAKDITGQVKSFGAYYGLYRGWFTIFILESFFIFILLIINWFNFWFLTILILSIIISFLFFRRLKRFYNYSRAKTLQTFMLIKKLEL